jgi:hypothetical protein
MNRHMSTVLSGLAVAAAIAALTASLQAQELTAAIRGRAISVDRQPIAEVEVTAQAASLPATARTRTGRDGAYLLRGLPPGDYVITFRAAGYVLLKRTTRLSALETAAMDAELVAAPQESYDPIVAVSEGRHMFIRWPLGATTFRTADVYELPLAGTPGSLLAIMPGSQLLSAPSLTIWNGVPVRGSALALTPAYTLNREALADMTLARGGQPVDVEAPTTLAVAARRGSDRLAGALLATGGTAGLAGDALWQTGERRAGDGTVAASFGGALLPRHVWFFAQGETFGEEFRQPVVFGEPSRTRIDGTSASGSLTFAWANRQRVELDAVLSRHDGAARVPGSRQPRGGVQQRRRASAALRRVPDPTGPRSRPRASRHRGAQRLGSRRCHTRRVQHRQSVERDASRWRLRLYRLRQRYPDDSIHSCGGAAVPQRRRRIT